MDDLPGSGTLFFGQRWDAPRVDHATQVDTPIGQRCLECEEPIKAGDRGLLMGIVDLVDGYPVASLQPCHLECELRSTMSHFMRQCHCFVQHATVRDEARATLAALNEHRCEQGLGPL